MLFEQIQVIKIEGGVEALDHGLNMLLNIGLHDAYLKNSSSSKAAMVFSSLYLIITAQLKESPCSAAQASFWLMGLEPGTTTALGGIMPSVIIFSFTQS